jgi:hypothetical protein
MTSRRGERTVLVALLGLALLLGCFPMSDFDVWWHLRTARLIVEAHAIPRVDVLTYTNAGRPWIDLYWFFQLVLGGLYKLGGPTALVLMKAVGGALVVFLAWLARRRGGRHWPLLLVWLPALVVVSGRLCERPELFSLIYLAAYLAVLAHVSEKPRLFWLLPLVQVLWVNSHGFFVLGPLVLVAYFADWLLDALRPRKLPVPRPPLKLAALTSAATLLACVASPYGVHAVDLPLQQFHKLGDSGLYRLNIGELKNLGDFMAQSGFNNPYLLGIFVLAGLGIASFALSARKGRPSLFRVLLFVAGAYLGWQATRNSALFALIAATVALWNLDDAFPPTVEATVKTPRSRKKNAPKKGGAASPAGALVVISAMALWILSGSLYAWAGEGRTIGLGQRPHWYAHEVCRFLAQPGMPAHVVAFNLGQAGVCSFHLRPTQTQFLDPRLEVNTADTFERYLDGIRKLWRDQPGWELPLGIDYAKPDEIPAILIEHGVFEPAVAALARNPRWQRVYSDEVAAAFVVKSPEP